MNVSLRSRVNKTLEVSRGPPHGPWRDEVIHEDEFIAILKNVSQHQAALNRSDKEVIFR